MEIQLSAVLTATETQRNKAQDDLAYMTAYAKALEARVAELEKPATEVPAEVPEVMRQPVSIDVSESTDTPDNTQNVTH